MQVSKGDLFPVITIASIFLLVGSACATGAFFLFRSSYRKNKYWKTTSGTVVDYDYVSPTQSMRSNPYYVPRIQFTTDDGKQVTCVASTGSNRQSYRIGANVKVVYSPDDPQKADLKSFGNFWVMPIFLGIFALASLGVSLNVFIHLIFIDSVKK
jgi:Protein of unknown function (DUF3592)